MIARPLMILITAAFTAMGARLPSRSGDYTLEYRAATPTEKGAVIVAGIDPENLKQLTEAEWAESRWAEVLCVTVPRAKGGKPLPIAGTYRVQGNTVRFTPRFPIEPGIDHLAEFHPPRLPTAIEAPTEHIDFQVPEPPKPRPASVIRMEPGGDVLPENLLKVYIHFSAPMSRGEVYDRVRLVDASGRTVEGAFLEIGEELWDSTGTRIMLLFDPGRIKRGLRPREEEGPILERGKLYTIKIDARWPDAAGQPMPSDFAKSFRAGPEDLDQPDPRSWKVGAPSASTRDPLRITFGDPLDRAMLDRALVLRDPSGKLVAGTATVAAESTAWTFSPAEPWAVGGYTLEVDPELEDLAGNSVARRFEVDAEGPVAPAKAVRLAIPIRADRP